MGITQATAGHEEGHLSARQPELHADGGADELVRAMHVCSQVAAATTVQGVLKSTADGALALTGASIGTARCVVAGASLAESQVGRGLRRKAACRRPRMAGAVGGHVHVPPTR